MASVADDFDVEKSKAIRLERLKSRMRDRGGIFVPEKANPLVDILLARQVSGASPLKSKPLERCTAPDLGDEGIGKEKNKPKAKKTQRKASTAKGPKKATGKKPKAVKANLDSDRDGGNDNDDIMEASAATKSVKLSKEGGRNKSTTTSNAKPQKVSKRAAAGGSANAEEKVTSESSAHLPQAKNLKVNSEGVQGIGGQLNAKKRRAEDEAEDNFSDPAHSPSPKKRARTNKASIKKTTKRDNKPSVKLSPKQAPGKGLGTTSNELESGYASCKQSEKTAKLKSTAKRIILSELSPPPRNSKVVSKKAKGKRAKEPEIFETDAPVPKQRARKVKTDSVEQGDACETIKARLHTASNTSTSLEFQGSQGKPKGKHKYITSSPVVEGTKSARSKEVPATQDQALPLPVLQDLPKKLIPASKPKKEKLRPIKEHNLAAEKVPLSKTRPPPRHKIRHPTSPLVIDSDADPIDFLS